MNKVERFNHDRIPFAVLGGKCVFTMADKRDIKDWLKESYGIHEEEYEKTIRGYMKDGKIYFYISSDFKPVNIASIGSEVLEHLQLLSNVYMKTKEPKCFNGIQIGLEGDQWEPIENLGTIQELAHYTA